MKLRFADPDSSRYEEPETFADHLSKEEVIKLAMDAFAWKESKCLSWYKLQIPQLGGNSPMELVQRSQTGKLVELLQKMAFERAKNSEKKRGDSE